MGREKRIQFAGGIYHVISRGVLENDIFVDTADRIHFLKILGRYSIDFNATVYSYALMNNHYHLLIRTNDNNLSSFMYQLNSRYAHYFNTKYLRVGHLFQDRYRSLVVDDDKYFITVLKYIALNPVVAGIVNFAEQYKWSSFRYFFEQNPYSWFQVDSAISLLDISRERFTKLVREETVDFDEFKEIEQIKKLTFDDVSWYVKIIEESFGPISKSKILRNSAVYYLRLIGASTKDIEKVFHLSRKGIYIISKKVLKETQQGNKSYLEAVNRIKMVLLNKTTHWYQALTGSKRGYNEEKRD